MESVEPGHYCHDVHLLDVRGLSGWGETRKVETMVEGFSITRSQVENENKIKSQRKRKKKRKRKPACGCGCGCGRGIDLSGRRGNPVYPNLGGHHHDTGGRRVHAGPDVYCGRVLLWPPVPSRCGISGCGVVEADSSLCLGSNFHVINRLRLYIYIQKPLTS